MVVVFGTKTNLAMEYIPFFREPAYAAPRPKWLLICFRICIKSNPRPNITISKLTLYVLRHILFLGIAKRPYLINLETLAGQIHHCFVLILLANPAYITEQLCYGILGYTRHSDSRTYAIALYQCSYDPNPLFFI